MRRLYFRRVLDSGLRSSSVGAWDAFPKSNKLSRLNNAQFADFDTHWLLYISQARFWNFIFVCLSKVVGL